MESQFLPKIIDVNTTNNEAEKKVGLGTRAKEHWTMEARL
jgi:hypothetical protein